MKSNQLLTLDARLGTLVFGVLGTIGFIMGIAAIGLVFYYGSNGGFSRTDPNVFPAQTQISPTADLGPFATASQTPETQVETSIPESPTTAELTPTPTQSITLTSPMPASPTPSPTTGIDSRLIGWAKLLDTSPENGAYFGPNYSFQKLWTLKNVGSTTWTTDYDLVFVSGTLMSDKKTIPLSAKVVPGKSLDLYVKMLTPKKPGIYESYWMLRNSSGDMFGIGPDADQALSVKIIVLNVDPESKYDFILNYCDAYWWNGVGESINCQGFPNSSKGFVLLDSLPVLENGPSDRPILWVHPNERLEGILSGRYPQYLVSEGDHFRAKVGCIGGYTKCNITFKLQYQIGSDPPRTLGSWQELYGGGITHIDVNLSHLAGEKVKFILRVVVSNNTPSAAQGFWMIPRIVYVKPLPTATLTPSPTATLVPSATATVDPAETPTTEDP